jgi:hypothetical protein
MCAFSFAVSFVYPGGAIDPVLSDQGEAWKIIAM